MTAHLRAFSSVGPQPVVVPAGTGPLVRITCLHRASSSEQAGATLAPVPLRVSPPSALAASRSPFASGLPRPTVPPSGFPTLSMVSFSCPPPALFHAGGAHGVWPESPGGNAGRLDRQRLRYSGSPLQGSLPRGDELFDQLSSLGLSAASGSRAAGPSESRSPRGRHLTPAFRQRPPALLGFGDRFDLSADSRCVSHGSPDRFGACSTAPARPDDQV
jgi:hypothetical protein